MGLFGDRGRGRFRKRVQQGLTTPSWQVLVGGKSWVCPFCATLALKKWPDVEEERVEAIIDHLDGQCDGFDGGEGEERPLPELKRIAARRELRRRIKKQLVANHSWQLVDHKRSWLCPYCAEPTQIAIPADRRMTEEVLNAIVSHVEGCFAWDHGRGAEKPHVQLKAVVKANNKLGKLVESVRRKLEGDPAWRRKDARQRWICPYCLQAQEHIDLSSNLLMFENAPRQIAQHLSQGCDAYARGAAPAPLEGGLAPQPLVESGTHAPGANAGPAQAPAQATRSSFRIESGSALAGSETGAIRDEGWSGTRTESRESRESREGRTGRDELGSRNSAAWGLDPGSERPARDAKEKVKERAEKEKKGVTLGQLRASGEFVQIDEAESRSGASSGSGKVAGSGRQKALRDWRQMIERELASVKEISPTLSGEIPAPSDGAQEKLRELQKKLRLGERGYELKIVSMPALPNPRGDFAEVIDLGQDRIALLVGGVAGDEPEAPLVSAMAKNLLRSHAAPDRCPTEVLQRVNADLYADLDGRIFFATALVLLDLPTRRLRLARAGLAPPLLVNPTRDPPFAALEMEGLVMGADKGPIFDSTIEVRALELFPGDMLVLHTNGVFDARPSANREEFGQEHMHQLVARYATHEVEYLVDKFHEHYEAHHEGLSQRLTDACLVALKWAGTR